MRKMILLIAMLAFAGLRSWAGTLMYEETLVDNTTGITGDTNFSLNLDSYGIDYLSVQATYSPMSFSAISGTTDTVNGADDTVSTAQAFPNGFALVYSSSSFSTEGLTEGATYYTIPAGTGYIQLATSKINALAGTAVDISTTPGAGTFTLTPITLAPFSYKWQGSNDNAYWGDLSVSSVTVTSSTSDNTTTLSDLGYTTYKYLRCRLLAGSWGAIVLKLRGYGKRNP